MTEELKQRKNKSLRLKIRDKKFLKAIDKLPIIQTKFKSF